MNIEDFFNRRTNETGRLQPSLSIGTLTADVMDQQSAIQLLEANGIELLHVDVMDGRIWPKITVGHFFVAGLKTNLLKDVHLLIEEPEKQIPSFVQAGSDMISFSVESCRNIESAIQTLRVAAEEAGRGGKVRCGLSAYPSTPVDSLKPFLDQVDYVTLVAIGPDTGKSNFLHEMEARVGQLRAWNENLIVCTDGAVKKTNIGQVASMGADVIVTGSAVFDGNDAAQNIREMKQQISTALSN